MAIDMAAIMAIDTAIDIEGGKGQAELKIDLGGHLGAAVLVYVASAVFRPCRVSSRRSRLIVRWTLSGAHVAPRGPGSCACVFVYDLGASPMPPLGGLGAILEV